MRKSVGYRSHMISQLLDFPGSFIVINNPMSNCRNPYPTIIIQNRIYRQTTGTPQSITRKEFRFVASSKIILPFSSIRQILFFIRRISDGNQKIILVIPACIFFLNRSRSSPSFDAHRFIKCSSLPEITQTQRIIPLQHPSRWNTLSRRRNHRQKPFFFQIKCRKDTIIHKCQHPVKNLL